MSSTAVDTKEHQSLSSGSSFTNSREIAVDGTKYLRWGLWAYFFLLIFEGALRKWILPQLSAPLLVVRDPIALYLIIVAWKKNLIPASGYLIAMVIVGIVSTIFTLVIGHGNIVVTVFGARILLLHFPVMFIMGSIFNREDVIQLGRVVLWMSIPMAVLMSLQFYSPQSAWVNLGVGGDEEGAGFSGALGFFRPPGTFSFTTGLTMFFSLVACYVTYFWISKTQINKIVLIGATIALLLSIPLSISRGLLLAVLITLFFAFISLAGKPNYWGRLLGAGVGLILLIAILSQTSVFQTSTEAFTSRFEDASAIEGGVAGTVSDRILGGMVSAIIDNDGIPFFGLGLGMGTNAGAALLTGERTFLIAEGEWARLIGEMGFLLGMIVILIRILFCFKLLFAGFKQVKKDDFLVWLLLSFGFMSIAQGQWAQPTALGFSTLMGGLILAALNTNGIEKQEL